MIEYTLVCYNVTWVNGLVLIVNNNRIYGRTPPPGNLNSCKLACIMAEKSEASCQTCQTGQEERWLFTNSSPFSIVICENARYMRILELQAHS